MWTFALGDVRLEKRVWMAHGASTTYVRWSLAPGSASRAIALEVTPLVTWRDHHATASAFEPRPSRRSRIDPAAGGSLEIDGPLPWRRARAPR